VKSRVIFHPKLHENAVSYRNMFFRDGEIGHDLEKGGALENAQVGLPSRTKARSSHSREALT
jgi:hypothetical protein